jgi:hypothetical protein
MCAQVSLVAYVFAGHVISACRAEEDHVVAGSGEVRGAQVSDDIAFEAAGVVEVEFLQRFAGREPGGADVALTAVGLAGSDFALQAGG